MKKNILLSTSLTLLILIVLTYNNCSYMFKTFGGSQELTTDHRDIAIHIVNSLNNKIVQMLEVNRPYLENSTMFFGRDRQVGYELYVQQYNEDIEELLFDLENDNIWYYVADEDNVGASAYGGTATIRMERFDDLIENLYDLDTSGVSIEEFDVFAAIDKNLENPYVKYIFFDLLHEVDHTITPFGHAPEFTASSSRFVDMDQMTREELLQHIADGLDVTYNIERGYIYDLLKEDENTFIYRERRSLADCIENVTEDFEDLNWNYNVGLIWSGVDSQDYEQLANAICHVREISRTANEANFCQRSLSFRVAVLGNWTCGEMRISDVEKQNYISAANKYISELKQGDLHHYDNLISIFLAHNYISSLTGQVFEGAETIQSLNLLNNPVSQMDSLAFQGLENVVVLNMGKFLLRELPDNLFMDMSALQNFNLRDGKLVRIKENSFAGLNNVLYLDIGMNEISEIEEGSFRWLNSILEFNLFGNKLTDLPPNWWNGINPNIQLFDFRGNQFSGDKKDEIKQIIQQNFPLATCLI